VRAEGGFLGVRGTANAGSSTHHTHGVYGFAYGTVGAGFRYGVLGGANGGASVYLVYGTATGAFQNHSERAMLYPNISTAMRMNLFFCIKVLVYLHWEINNFNLKKVPLHLCLKEFGMAYEITVVKTSKCALATHLQDLKASFGKLGRLWRNPLFKSQWKKEELSLRNGV
jgi:hypothetical protein